MRDVRDALSAVEFNADLNDDDLIVDAFVVMRVQDETGRTWITTAVTEHTDDIITAGLLSVLDQVRAGLTLMRDDL